MTTPMTKEALAELALREKFEAWTEEACALPWGYLKKRRTYSGHYSEHVYTSTWAVWKAATAESIDALEAKDKRIAELESENKRAWKQAGSARRGFDEQQSLAESAEKRVAELEESHRQVIEARDFYKRLHEEGLKAISVRAESAEQALPDGLLKAVEFYEQVKRENTAVETGAWKDAVDWVLKEVVSAAGITLQIQGGE